MSQSFHDGNDDVKWTRGALMTTKAKALLHLTGDLTYQRDAPFNT